MDQAMPKQRAIWPYIVVTAAIVAGLIGGIGVLGWVFQANSSTWRESTAVLLVEQPGNIELYANLLQSTGVKVTVDGHFLRVSAEAATTEAAQQQAQDAIQKTIETVNQLQSAETGRRLALYQAIKAGAANGEMNLEIPVPTMADLAPRNFGSIYVFQEPR